MPKTLSGAQPGDLIVGAMMLVLGVIGLVMAAKALDSEIFIFGSSLTLFAIAFIFGLIRTHFDRHEKSRAGEHS